MKSNMAGDKKEFITEEAKLVETIEKTNSEELRNIAGSYLKNLNDIFFMHRLPEIILLHSISHSEFLVEGLKICSRFGKDDYTNEKVLDELKMELAKVPIDKDIVEKRYKDLASWGGLIWAESEMERISRIHRQHWTSRTALLKSVVVWMWTLFEVATGDLWETTLNKAFYTIGRKALQSISEAEISNTREKVGAKYIRIDDLAQFDFNLKENVGSILKNHFDFNSLRGIQKAYEFVFKKSTSVQESLKEKALQLLAEDRNLIVHKAGRVDSKYKEITGTNVSIGEEIFITGDKLNNYHATIVRAFRVMLNCCNEYLNLEAANEKE